MSRIEALRGFLSEDPDDSFSRYALAIEYGKLGQEADAIREFETVIDKDPDYVATYYQLGKVFERIGRIEDAEKTYRAGITVAGRAGDGHTKEELQAALEALADEA